MLCAQVSKLCMRNYPLLSHSHMSSATVGVLLSTNPGFCNKQNITTTSTWGRAERYSKDKVWQCVIVMGLETILLGYMRVQ